MDGELSIFIQQTVNAISLGGTYALLALGLAIIFSIMGMINFAHGELMTITGYTLMYCGLAGLPFYISAPLAVVVATVAAVLMERIAFRPVRNGSPASMLVTSFAVAIILQTLFQNLISTRSKPVILPDVFAHSVHFGNLSIGINQILSISLTVVILVSLNWFLRKTILGMAMRAAAEDFSVARLMGVRANAIIAGAFAISGALAGAAGVLWVAQRASVDPHMGFVPVLKAFIAAILGGLGSLTGAVAGGFALGFIEIYLAAYLPENIQPYKEALALGLVIAILLVRPNGLIPAATIGKEKV
ncbi:MAG: branched-chain amino acid ABC transporter permease [Alphaproteobacteria bacterium]